MGADFDNFDFSSEKEKKNLIKVDDNTNINELLNSLEELINKDDKKQLNLIAFGDSIEILEKIIKKINEKNPKLNIFKNVYYDYIKIDDGINEIYKKYLKLDILIMLNKPEEIPLYYKNDLSEEDNKLIMQLKEKKNYKNEIYTVIKNIINSNNNSNNNKNMINNDLKIDLYPEKEPRNDFIKKSLKNLIKDNKTFLYSFDINQNLAFIDSNVPVLNGFYSAHINHYPIRIKPDDIWLIIVQAFSNYVNSNSEELRKYFVNFDGKKVLTVSYHLDDLEQVQKEHLEDFSKQINKQMIEYLGEELIDTLTPNFTTTDDNSLIIFKISIMGAFKQYFEYKMELEGCGIPYIILEGTAEDYKKIISKLMKLKKYEFDWYIDKVAPHLIKMYEAKDGKIDLPIQD